MPRSRSATPSSRRSRSVQSDRESSPERKPDYRVHIAELPPGMQDEDIRKLFERFGTILEVWVANASCFAFVVYKQKEDAQNAIDRMDGRLMGNYRLKVTWARPRTHKRSRRRDPNMRCYKCGEQGHFSRECNGEKTDRRTPRRRDDDWAQYPPINHSRYSRDCSSYSSSALPPPSYFRHGLPMYPSFSRRYDPSMEGYFPLLERSNGLDYRYRDRGTRLTPPSTSGRYGRR